MAVWQFGSHNMSKPNVNEICMTASTALTPAAARARARARGLAVMERKGIWHFGQVTAQAD